MEQHSYHRNSRRRRELKVNLNKLLLLLSSPISSPFSFRSSFSQLVDKNVLDGPHLFAHMVEPGSVGRSLGEGPLTLRVWVRPQMEKKLIIPSSHRKCLTAKHSLPVSKGSELRWGFLLQHSGLLLLQSGDMNGCFFSEVILSGKLTVTLLSAFHSLEYPWLIRLNHMTFGQQCSISLGGSKDISPRCKVC